MENPDNNKISELIARYRLGIGTEDEEKELLEWRSASKLNEQTFLRICSSDFIEQGFRHNFRSEEEHKHQKNLIERKINSIRLRRRIMKYSSVAAALLVGLFLLLFIPKKQSERTVAYQKVLLQLPSGEYVELEEEETNLLSEEKSVLLKKEEDTLLQKDYTIIVPPGRTHKLVFSDGSTVMLNSNSQITYPIPFSKKDRRVSFKGEAWFEIAKDASRPFILSVDKLAIEVLGTAFAVRSDNLEVRTTLVRGSVKVTDASRGNSLILKPSQQALFNSEDGNLTSQEVNIDEFIAWKDGYWYFDNRPLGYIINELSRNYGFSYEFADKALEQLPLSFKLKREYDYMQVLNTIEKTNLFKINAYKDKIVIDN